MIDLTDILLVTASVVIGFVYGAWNGWRVKKIKSCLTFYPSSVTPRDQYADYILYSKCTGFILAESMFYGDDGFQYFHKPFDLTFEEITDFHYWAVLPKLYYQRGLMKDENKSTLNALANFRKAAQKLHYSLTAHAQADAEKISKSFKSAFSFIFKGKR